jgi:hypothetical protein
MRGASRSSRRRNQITRRALDPCPKELMIVTKVGFRRGEDKSWSRRFAPSV